jgi:hypothetical protein
VFGTQDNCKVKQVENFVRTLESMLSEKGVQVYIPDDISRLVVYMGQKLDIEGTLRNAREVAIKAGQNAIGKGIARKNKREIDMVLCVMMGRNTVYPEIKRYAETNMGVMTQCMLAKVSYHPFLIV